MLHRQGRSWVEIGDLVGQRSRIVTADRCSHALVDYREIDRAKLLAARLAPETVLAAVTSLIAKPNGRPRASSDRHTRAAKFDAPSAGLEVAVVRWPPRLRPGRPAERSPPCTCEA
jgi:hypothetical protein